MRVIVVRHGKTELGASHRFQSPNTPLSAQGAEAVMQCANTLAQERVTKVYTSGYQRAVETAQVIAKRHALVPQEHKLFFEKYNSSAVIGRSYVSVPFLVLGLTTIAHLFVRQAKYKDEETLDELWERADEARAYLSGEAKHEDTVIVVSHALWIAAFLGACEKERPRIIRYVILVLRALCMRNTQQYVLELDNVTKAWKRLK